MHAAGGSMQIQAFLFLVVWLWHLLTHDLKDDAGAPHSGHLYTNFSNATFTILRMYVNCDNFKVKQDG